MIDKNVVRDLVEQWLQDTDYFLTDLNVSEDDRIVVEIDHAEGVWIDDCVKLSRYIEDNLSRDKEDYELEVGSAGIGQPFKVKRQYEIHVGSQIEVLTAEGKRLTGTLTAVNEENFTLSVPTKIKTEGMKRPKLQDVDHTFRFDEVKEARYVIDFK